MDRATMIAENQERDRQFTFNMAFQAARSWPVRETSVVQFAWSHAARFLIHQRKVVLEIMALRAKVDTNLTTGCAPSRESFLKQWKCLDVPISFHEAFVYSHEQCVRLIDRVHEQYDTHWFRYILEMHASSFPQKATGDYVPTLEMTVANWTAGMTGSYAIAQSTMAQYIDSILEMQTLSEDLMPETRDLVTRCADSAQLDRSMIMAEGMDHKSVEDFTFKSTAPIFATPKAFM